MSVEEPVTDKPSQPAGGAAEPATATAGASGGGGGAAPAPGRSSRDAIGEFLARYGVLIAFVLMVLVFSLAKPDTFPTWENWKNILTAAAPALIVAAGLTVPLVMQDFDLSFGAMISLAGGAAVTLMAKDDVGWVLAILAGLGLGLAAGFTNGFLIAYLGGSSFIITLAMGTVLTGVEFAITSQDTIFTGVAASYVEIAQNTFLGLSNQVWIAAVLALLVWVLLDLSEPGRYMYAIGGNPEAARLSGISTKRLRLTGFVIVAVMAAIAGILLTGNSASYSPSLGASFLLPAFAAVFLGSAVLRPGEFNLPGTVIGVLFLGAIQTGLTQLNLEAYVINLVQGGILIFAVLLSRLGQRTV
jgi:ribose transport system permease protein